MPKGRNISWNYVSHFLFALFFGYVKDPSPLMEDFDCLSGESAGFPAEVSVIPEGFLWI